jgi:hypothetical protein
VQHRLREREDGGREHRPARADEPRGEAAEREQRQRGRDRGRDQEAGPAAGPGAEREPGRRADQELRQDVGAGAVHDLVERRARQPERRVGQRRRAPPNGGQRDVDRQRVPVGDPVRVLRVRAGVRGAGRRARRGSAPPRRRARPRSRPPRRRSQAGAGVLGTRRVGAAHATTAAATARAGTASHPYQACSGTRTAASRAVATTDVPRRRGPPRERTAPAHTSARRGGASWYTGGDVPERRTTRRSITRTPARGERAVVGT